MSWFRARDSHRKRQCDSGPPEFSGLRLGQFRTTNSRFNLNFNVLSAVSQSSCESTPCTRVHRTLQNAQCAQLGPPTRRPRHQQTTTTFVSPATFHGHFPDARPLSTYRRRDPAHVQPAGLLPRANRPSLPIAIPGRGQAWLWCLFHRLALPRPCVSVSSVALIMMPVRC